MKHMIKGKINFPHLTQPNIYGKYGAEIVIAKNSPTLKVTKTALVESIPNDCGLSASFSYDGANTNLYDGDTTSFAFNADGYVLKLTSSKPVACIDAENNEMSNALAADMIVKGAIVLAQVSYWFQDNSYGKAVRANVHAVKLLEAPSRNDMYAKAAFEDFEENENECEF
jgi:hypothetical protein